MATCDATSYPYLALSQRLKLDYGVVLTWSDTIEQLLYDRPELGWTEDGLPLNERLRRWRTAANAALGEEAAYAIERITMVEVARRKTAPG